MRWLLCLLAALLIAVAAGPVTGTQSSRVWAKSSSSKKKSTKKKKKKVKNGFVKRSGRWYYLVDGKKQTGWITVGKRVYYGKKHGSYKGSLLEGWQEIGKKEYYFRESGKKKVVCSAVRGRTEKINGISCVFRKDGSFKKYKYASGRGGFINTVGELARHNQCRNNLLASLTVAQACLETGYGRQMYRNNLFGIRAGSGYRSYRSYEESVKDYTAFMRRYIPRIFGVRNASTACAIVGRSGYAEAGGYGSILISIVHSNGLTRFDR